MTDMVKQIDRHVGLKRLGVRIATCLLCSFVYAQPTSVTNPVAKDRLEKGPVVCGRLDARMQAVDAKTDIGTLHHINDDLKSCVKNASNEQLLTWIVHHADMYHQFTALTEADENVDFYELAMNYQGGKVNVSQFKQLTPRVKYLAQQLGNSEITLYDEGEGYFSFWYKLSTTVDIFDPSLPSDQASYLKRMAKENQQAFLMDAAIVWSYDELIEAIIFWENFTKQYPNSKLARLAKERADFYQYFLFFGSDNTRWTDDAITKIDDDKLSLLKKVAIQPNSEFANRAKRFINFLAMTKKLRNQAYPVFMLDEDNRPKEDWQLAHEQLDKALAIPEPNFEMDKTSCSVFRLPCP